jgi:HK97 family phage major capsid protein
VLGLAILQASLADFPPDGIAMHPSDWWRIRLTEDFEGRYLFGALGEDVTPRLSALPVVPTQAMVAEKFVVGSFQAAGTIYDR